jgi:predicted outer membrane repeat protein
MRFPLLVSLVLFIALSNAAHGEPMNLGSRVVDDPRLQEDYGNISTSINWVEFSLLPRSEVSLQQLIDGTADGEIRYIDPGYYASNTTYQINKNLTLVGNGLAVIDALRACEIFHIGNPFLTVKLENIAFVNGNGPQGGAIGSIAKNLTLVNCTLINNIAEEGACVYSHNSRLHIINSSILGNLAFDSIVANENGTIILEGVVFDDNSALMLCDGINVTETLLIIRDSKFRNNRGYATSGSRGGCEVSLIGGHGTIFIDNSESSSNSAEIGSGTIHVGGNLTITNCNIVNNSVSSSMGKSFLQFDGGNATIANCMISDNMGCISFFRGSSEISNCTINHNVGLSGGAIYNGGVLNIIGSSFSDNLAREGGAIYNSDSGRLNVDGLTIFENNSAQDGGAIYNIGGQVQLEGEPYFISNEAQKYGGAIYNNGTIGLEDAAIFTDNNALNGSNIYNLGTLTDTGNLSYRNATNINVRMVPPT